MAEGSGLGWWSGYPRRRGVANPEPGDRHRGLLRGDRHRLPRVDGETHRRRRWVL